MSTQKRNLRIKMDRKSETVDLAKRMGSKNKTESTAAAEAFAAVMTRPILQVIEQAPVISNLFTSLVYDINTPSTIPLDDYFDVRQRNLLNVWNQNQPGGNAMNFQQGATELYVQTAQFVSEIAFNKNYLRAGNIDHLAAGLTRLVQEVLLVNETNAAFVLFNSAANARIDGNAANTATNNLTIARANTAGRFQLDDFNTMMIGYDRTTASWVGGTPVLDRRALTDMIGSPEWMGQIRSIAYQPSNTVGGLTNGSNWATSIAAPESVREQIFNGGAIPTLFDVILHKVYEMGTSRPYNQIFATALGTVQLPGFGTGFGGGNTSLFNPATEQIVVGLNSEMFDLARLTATEGNSEFSLVNDDSFTLRSDKLGVVGTQRVGYVSVEGRAKFSLSF